MLLVAVVGLGAMAMVGGGGSDGDDGGGGGGGGDGYGGGGGGDSYGDAGSLFTLHQKVLSAELPRYTSSCSCLF